LQKLQATRFMSIY